MNIQKNMSVCLWYNCLGGLVLFVSAYLYSAGMVSYSVFYFYFLYIFTVFIGGLYRKQTDFITSVAYVFLGQIYIALPFALLNKIAFPVIQAEIAAYYPALLLALFVFIWINDTFAYVTGSLLKKKHALFERISPKKSWEGFFGGLIFTVMSSFIFASNVPQIPCYHWMGLSMAVVIFGTWGDLVESLMKRTLKVKDSGKAMPGHGGFLDRFDSLLLAIYGVLFYIQLFIK
jgi:phosphatidate cytidylyltransferase